TTPGGAGDFGSVFMLSPPAGGETAWTKTELYKFEGSSDGGNPFATLLLRGRNLYGMTATRGDAGCQGCKPGVVFRLLRGDGAQWRFSVMPRFASYNAMPPTDDPLAIDDDGALYATSLYDGAPCPDGKGCGTVYQLVPPANSEAGQVWTKKIVHSFKGGFNGF